eukprot:1161615-Pelagomonas_calceolata.AAC.14
MTTNWHGTHTHLALPQPGHQSAGEGWEGHTTNPRRQHWPRSAHGAGVILNGHTQRKYDNRSPVAGVIPNGHTQWRYDNRSPVAGVIPNSHTQWKYDNRSPVAGVIPNGHTQWK